MNKGTPISFKHVLIPVTKLVSDTANPRKRNARNLAAIRSSIKEHGQVEPVVVQKHTHKVIHGNGRLQVMAEMGFDEVACAVVDVDDQQARKLSIVLNRSGELADWDDAVLTSHLTDLISYDPDFSPDALGFSNAELEALLEVSDPSGDNIYTAKIESPVYEITGEEPPVEDLYETSRYSRLIEDIEAADLDPALKAFLMSAAARHVGFRYDLIAEYYAHASADVQRLFEDSALVIIDFDKAVENGFVKLTAGLNDAYMVDHGTN